MLDLKSSPLSRTPTNLPVIPGVTLDDNGKIIEEIEEVKETSAVAKTSQLNGDQKKATGKNLLFYLKY